jgi:hypothetical protein
MPLLQTLTLPRRPTVAKGGHIEYGSGGTPTLPVEVPSGGALRGGATARGPAPVVAEYVPGESRLLLSPDSKKQIALDARRAWMRRMALSEEEIEQSCHLGDPSLDLDEELKQLWAAIELSRITPGYAELRDAARRVAPSVVFSGSPRQRE